MGIVGRLWIVPQCWDGIVRLDVPQHGDRRCHSLAGAMQGCVVGILMHIGTVVLFEAGEGHHFQPGKLMAVLAGLGLSLVAFG